MNKGARPNAQIRKAEPDDAEQIALVLRRSFAEYEPLYTPEAFAATISTPDKIRERMKEGPIWVALQDGAIVGTVSAVAKADALYIRGMAVDPATRGLRIGHALLEHVEEFAVHQGFKRLFLSTTPFLADAIHLYERHGFERNDDEPHDLSGTPLFTMAKTIESSGQ